MVVLVVISVTLVVIYGVGGMVSSGDFGNLDGVLGHYTEFASVVFVAYSGNSVAEKWLINSHRDEQAEG